MASRRKSDVVPTVFVDTAAWIALLNRSDALRPRALEVMATLQQQKSNLVTTELVLLEVADALSAPRFRAKVVTFVDGLRKSGVTQIIPGGRDLLDAGWELYRQRPDKEWGLTDCTSFVVMEQQQITQAVTSDQHFEQAGFVKLL
jgi:predicted nucleic acid-binding protein